MFEAFKWFMRHDIPLKNATSGLAGLLSAIIFFFLARGTQWFAELQAISGGLWLMLSAVFFVAFLSVHIAWHFGSQIHRKHKAEQQLQAARAEANRDERQKSRTMYDTLDGLTDWQKNTLIRQLRSGHPRFEAYEIGGYKIVWETEIEELIRKNVVRQPSYEVFEVTPCYWTFLCENYDLENNRLSLDDI